MSQKELKFEDAIKRIELIVNQLEKGDVPLEESIKLFEEGMTLIKQCQQRLEEVEKKVELLLNNGNGGYETKPFDPNASRTETQID